MQTACRVHRAAYLLLITAALCCAQQSESEPSKNDWRRRADLTWEQRASLPSIYVDLVRKILATRKPIYLKFDVDRAFTREQMVPMSVEKPTASQTIDEWDRWFMAVRWILRDVGILREPFGRCGSRTIERSRDFDLKEYEYREQAESKGQDGDTFVIARVLTAIVHSTEFEEINLVYYTMRGFMVRQLLGQDGPFPDVPVEVGDACYHLANDGFGFLRGNVIVEIGLTPGWREDGTLKTGFPDTALRKKMVEAAKRIDAMLMEKMFDEETRARIIAHDEARQSCIDKEQREHSRRQQGPHPSP